MRYNARGQQFNSFSAFLADRSGPLVLKGAACPDTLSKKKRTAHRIEVRDPHGRRRRFTVSAYEFAEFLNYGYLERKRKHQTEAFVRAGYTCWRDDATQRLVFRNELVVPGVRIKTMTGLLLEWLLLYHPSAPYRAGGYRFRPATMAEQVAA